MSALLKHINHRDASILRIFNDSLKCRFLDFVTPIITYLGSLTFCAGFCVVTILYPNSFSRYIGSRTTLSLIISSVIAQIIKVSVNRIRPYLMLTNLHTKKIGIDKYSFPSGHTTAAFAIATMLSLVIPSMAILWITVACTVGVSRMYLGVHYPSDVLVGMLLGTISSLVIYHI